MVDRVQVVDAELDPSADICGGGQGSAWDLLASGAAAPNSPADVIRKSLRVDILEISNRHPIDAIALGYATGTLYPRHRAPTMSQDNDIGTRDNLREVPICAQLCM